MQTALANLNVKILTSVVTCRNIAICTILRYYDDDDDAVATLHFIQVGSKLVVNINKIKSK